MRSAIALIALLAGSAVMAQQSEIPRPEAPAYSVAEPKAPPQAQPVVRQRAAKANAEAAAQPPTLADAEVLKPNGPCVIKPVMSDQDLVNCGARLHH